LNVVHELPLRGAWGRLSASTRTALTRAGLSAAGALDGMSDLPVAEVKLFLDSLLEGDSVDIEGELELFLELIAASEGPAKRLRRSFAMAPAEVAAIWLPVAAPVDAAPHSSRRLTPAPPPPADQLARWPTRLRRDLALSEGPAAAHAAEERERARWVDIIVGALRLAQLPAAVLAEKALDPDAVLRRCVGGRRARTLRTRARAWQKFQSWMGAAGQHGFPEGDDGVLLIVRYLEERASEPCARTVPGASSRRSSSWRTRAGALTSRRSPSTRWSSAPCGTSRSGSLGAAVGTSSARPRSTPY